MAYIQLQQVKTDAAAPAANGTQEEKPEQKTRRLSRLETELVWIIFFHHI